MKEIHETYFPLTKIIDQNRDIAIVEFQSAQDLSNSQTKVYTQFASILIGLVTLIVTMILSADKINLGNILSENLMFLSLTMFFIGFFLLRYFVDLQKEITINARKVVTLRAMLGLDYHSVQLTLPKDRIEGATDPFQIKFFNGWFNFQAVPFWTFLVLVGYLWTLNFYSLDIEFLKLILVNKPGFNYQWGIGLMVIITLYYYTYRVNLFDRNETLLLHISVFISKIFFIKMLNNFEYSIYRARLSYIEIGRLNIDYRLLEKTLVKIEDSSYFKHKGISFKSLLRAFFSQIPYTRRKFGLIKSGASTLEMQLARTIFIPTNQNKFKRKLLEFFMSKWLNQILSKEEIIKIYIASVRYGSGVMGLSEGLKKYFKLSQLDGYIIDEEHAFFLVERLSNISGTVKWDRVEYLSNKIPNLNMEKLKRIYGNNKSM